MTKVQHQAVRSRNEPFAERMATNIWQEKPSADNPYITATAYCHGYELFDLIEKRSFVDVFYLLFRGELPTKEQSLLLQALMIAIINPGPRHPATRAAMNVGVGKTDPLHILPIASALLGGEYAGGKEVELAMAFFQSHCEDNSPELIESFFVSEKEITQLRGFGQRHGGIELMAKKLATQLVQYSAAGKTLIWGNQLATYAENYSISWLTTGVAAAVFCDLGFQPRMGACLFQLLSAPGLLAHGLEFAGKPILSMPFISDDNYVIER